MKHLLFCSFLTASSLISCSQDIPASKVPSVVLNSFTTEYSGVKGTDWEKKTDGYEAEFRVDRIELKVLYNEQGQKLKSKTDIDRRNMPSTVKAYVDQKHTGYKVDDVELVEMDGKKYYQLELDSRGKQDLNIVLDDNARLSTVSYWK